MTTSNMGAESQQQYADNQRVSYVSAAVNVMLAVTKILAGIFGHSQALLADGIHSLSDLVTDLLVIVTFQQSYRDADDSHPYGHGRIETAATLLLGLFLLAVAAGIMIDAVSRLTDVTAMEIPSPMVLYVAALSIISNEGLYFYSMKVANRSGSALLKANAWHHRTDSLSSIVVLIGVGGTLLGFSYFDAAAAIVVALMIAKIGVDLARASFSELIDSSLDEHEIADIRQLILSVDGVLDVHALRTRRFGGGAMVDAHVMVNPDISVSEGHLISERINGTLISKLNWVLDVLVHIDIEDDETELKLKGLPLRTEVEQQILTMVAPQINTRPIRGITLHYLDGSINVELHLPISEGKDIEALCELSLSLKNKVQSLPHIKHAEVHWVC